MGYDVTVGIAEAEEIEPPGVGGNRRLEGDLVLEGDAGAAMF
jgi:hypothetical protein